MTPTTPREIKVMAELPLLPNFIRIQGCGEGAKVDVANLTDEALRQLGAEWTEALVAHAKKRRKNRDH